MTTQSVSKKFNVNIIRRASKGGGIWYTAYRGGNGTSEPVVDIAEAMTLRMLSLRLERKVASR
jgi:hypothetical protein